MPELQRQAPQVRELGVTEYGACWQAMREFTARRSADDRDEIWLTEHAPVFTLGQAGLDQHVLDRGDIPLVRTDRGGQITYHGPGQIVAYLLINIKQRGYGVRELVWRMEQSILDLLAQQGVYGQRRERAPGVYVGEAKIAALGLRIRQGCSYHGLALNVDMDLSPFARINPCGYQGLRVTQLRDQAVDATMAELKHHLAHQLVHHISTHSDRQDTRG